MGLYMGCKWCGSWRISYTALAWFSLKRGEYLHREGKPEQYYCEACKKMTTIRSWEDADGVDGGGAGVPALCEPEDR